ncbi:MAG: hypothetical protein ACXADL_05450 [Candidatus Thorarchaeota archaeon]|jgi:hypothetical protein
MGRTVETHRMAVDRTEKKWKLFRRQLRPKDRKHFDIVFDYARMHGDSGTLIAVPHKFDIIFLSAMIEMLKRISELETQLEFRS